MTNNSNNAPQIIKEFKALQIINMLQIQFSTRSYKNLLHHEVIKADILSIPSFRSR